MSYPHICPDISTLVVHVRDMLDRKWPSEQYKVIFSISFSDNEDVSESAEVQWEIVCVGIGLCVFILSLGIILQVIYKKNRNR